MTDLISTLRARGLFQDATPGLSDRLAKGPLTGYVGFDPTADSLHVGSLIPVMGLVWLQRFGGKPVVLVGGGTGLVGDPSGKRSERPMLSEEAVEVNCRGLHAQLSKFVDFEGANAARLYNNHDWLKGLSLLDFLRDTGKHFTVNYMLQKDSVKSRMETGISFTEFSYMLVQAYDYWHLHRTVDCELQMGGSDQWGNITAGIELIGRRDGAEAHGLIFPLLTTSTGAKFGKSESGNVWLDPAKTSPYKFYQFWLNSDDADVERLLKLFTTLDLEEIAAAMAAQRSDPGQRVAQRLLARDITSRVHGQATTERVLAASEVVFGGRSLREADGPTLEIVAGEVATIAIDRSRLTAGLGVIDALVESGLASSKAEARRGVQGQGFSINGEKIASVDQSIGLDHLLSQRFVAIQKGKRSYAFLEVR